MRVSPSVRHVYYGLFLWKNKTIRDIDADYVLL